MLVSTQGSKPQEIVVSNSSKYAALGLGLAFVIAAGAPARAMTDAELLKQAAKGDNSEVELGRLALSKTSDPSVKSFAQALVDDHSKGKLQVMAVSKQVGVMQSDDVSPEAKQEYTKLEPLNGAAFDKEFVSYMVDDHQKDIADFKQQAGSSNGPVQKLASDTLPTLQKHLDMAKSLASKM